MLTTFEADNLLRAKQRTPQPSDPGSPVSQENLHRLFRYEDGRLFNRVRRSIAQTAGKEAGAIAKTGYRIVSVNNRRYLQHRLIWVMFYGNNLPYRVDHIDQNPLNNRIENLRAATQSLNGFNAGIRKNNKSGFPGVWRIGNRWLAGIGFMRKNILLGCFGTKEEAIAARLAGELKYYGEYAQKRSMEAA